MSFTPNPNFDVEAFLSFTSLPIFENDLTVTKTMNSEYASDLDDNRTGNEGASTVVRLPTKLRNNNTLAFDPISSGNFIQRQFSITVELQQSNNVQVQDIAKSVYDEKGQIDTNIVTQIVEISNAVEKYNIGVLQNTGYRWYGDAAVTPGSLLTVAETDLSVNTFQSFGMPAGSEIYYVVPYNASSQILQSAYQQFVTKRNDELAIRGEVGYLNGVDRTLFMKSNFLNVHIAGTAADEVINLSTGYTITSVTPNSDYGNISPTQPNVTESQNTSEIVLEGMTPNTTVVEGDLFDIGFFNRNTNPLLFLTDTGYQPSENPVQGRVITGGTVDGSGTLTITVQPAYIFDATGTNPFTNINRAIITGTDENADTIRFVRSHRAGLIYFGNQMFFLNPKLPNTDPYPSSSIRSEAGFAMRSYHGHIIGYAGQQLIHDVYFGSAGNPAAAGRLVFPITTSI